VFAALALITPITTSGIFYLSGLGLIGLAGLLSPWQGRKARFPLWIGATIFLLTAGTRLVTTNGNDQLYVVTLPGERSARWVNRFVDERDLTMFGTRILPFVGWILPGEAVGAIPAFQAAYSEIYEVGGNVPSPVAATYLWMQRPHAFDAVVVEPNGNNAPKAGTVFLHGFTGNFLMECWLFAKAAREAGLLTICPSVGWFGDWWKPCGAEIFEQTLAYLHTRGVERVYLAGLSNGGVGAGTLAYQYADQLNGLILISGLSPQAPVSGMPTLVIHGRGDGRVPVVMAQEYAQRVSHTTYWEFAGDHFLLAKDAQEVQEVIKNWLIDQE